MEKRPHIVIFNPDEMRTDSLSHMGNRAARTPNLDNFIKEDAVSFSNAFCQNPVCVPSRCSFMTGLYPHTNGHRTMSYLLHRGEDSLLKELKDNGYYVWMNDRNDLTAGDEEGWTEEQADEIFYAESKKRAPGPLVNKPKNDINAHGFYSHYHGQLGLDEDGLNYTADDQAVDAAITRILNPVDDRPMCIFLGLFYPHVPYNVEEPYFSSIDRKQLPPRIKIEDTKNKSKMLYKLNEYSHMSEYSEEEWDELRATYLGMVSKVDHQFKKLCDALKKAGIYDDTAIFFFSDHGDYAGDYSNVEKAQNSFEDCLVKVPFLIKPPKGYEVDPGISTSLVELVDFYATAIDMAKIKPSHTHFGKSLVEVIASRDKEVRDFVLSEGGREKGEIHCDEFHAQGPSGPAINNDYYPKMLAEKDDEAHDKGIMIRDHRYKYVSRSATKDEFYDLEKDPNELINEIDNPIYKDEIQAKQLQCLKYLQHTSDIVPFKYDARFTKRMMWAKVSGMVHEDDKEEVLALIDKGIAFGALISHCVVLMMKRRQGAKK